MGSSPPNRDDRGEPRDRRELDARLDELEETLEALRGELTTERRGPPRPPRLGELLRFTEQYSIPTLIALLEATIQSLELLRRTLRLADPGRAAREETEAARGHLDRAGAEAGQQVANALADLRTALSATESPSNPESRRLLEDARGLTAEIEARLRDAEATVRTGRETDRRRDRTDADRTDQADTDRTGRTDAGSERGVMIDVTEDDPREAADGRDGDETATRGDDEGPHADEGARADGDAAPAVDVDAELESIRHELGRGEPADAAGGDDSEADDAADADDADAADADSQTDETSRKAGDDSDTAEST
jgi:hypothetical protein